MEEVAETSAILWVPECSWVVFPITHFLLLGMSATISLSLSLSHIILSLSSVHKITNPPLFYNLV